MSKLVKFTSPAVDLAELGDDYSRADIEFEGVDHSGSTYEARIYLNNPDAHGDTEPTAENGYAGSFYVFGHGGCYGDQGHCDVVERGPYDPRPPHGLSPTRKVVIATDAVRRAASQGKAVSITVVPVLMSTTEKVPEDEEIPGFESVSLITYQ
jgi:tyrosinase